MTITQAGTFDDTSGEELANTVWPLPVRGGPFLRSAISPFAPKGVSSASAATPQYPSTASVKPRFIVQFSICLMEALSPALDHRQ